MNMLLANKALLDECRQYYNQLMQDGSIHGISMRQRLEIERVIRDEFLAGYYARHDCEACIYEMIKLAYMFYDKYLNDEKREH